MPRPNDVIIIRAEVILARRNVTPARTADNSHDEKDTGPLDTSSTSNPAAESRSSNCDSPNTEPPATAARPFAPTTPEHIDLDSAVLEEVWPKAKHQLCVFHLLKEINADILDALRRLRQEAFPKSKRTNRKRGRPTKALAKSLNREQELAERVSVGKLRREKFAKATSYLWWTHRTKLRTNNHVERMNRVVRLKEKVRYGWRKRRSIVRFLVVSLGLMRDQREAMPPISTKRLLRRSKRKPTGK